MPGMLFIVDIRLARKALMNWIAGCCHGALRLILGVSGSLHGKISGNKRELAGLLAIPIATLRATFGWPLPPVEWVGLVGWRLWSLGGRRCTEVLMFVLESGVRVIRSSSG